MTHIFDVFADEIKDIANDALKRAEAAVIVRLSDEHGGVSALHLDGHDRTAADSAAMRLWRLMHSFSGVLRRHGASAEADVAREKYHALEPYVRLDCKFTGDIAEQTWRAQFAQELSKRVGGIVRLMEPAKLLAVHPHGSMSYEEYFVHFSTIDSERLRDAMKIPTALSVPGAKGLNIERIAGVGQELLQSGFSDASRNACITARDAAARRGHGVRIRLCFQEAPYLAELPWELLHDGRQFLGLSRGVSIVRGMRQANVITPIFSRPTRILVTVSSPKSLAWLDAHREILQLESAVHPLVVTGQLELAFVMDGSVDTTRRKLQSAYASGRPFDAWHFIGHGTYDHETGYGKLAMTGKDGALHLITGWEIGQLFADHPKVRFAFLNACDSTSGDPTRPKTTIAGSLLELGFDCVIAMQMSLAENSAIIFTTELYAAMADGAGLDEAVTGARQAVFFSPDLVGWSAPVLFM